MLKKIPGLSITAFFPAYNDDVTIQSMVVEMDYILKQLCDDYEIIVVNDGSKDRTGLILDELARNLPRFKVIHNPKNLGYGGCLKTGFKAASKDWVFYTDGDGQYDVKEIVSLIAKADEADIVTGYKIARSDSIVRVIIGKVYHNVNKIIFNLKVRDVDCDFRLMRRTLVQSVDFKTETGFFPVEMMRQFQDKGARIVEVPVHHYYRKTRQSQFFSVKNILKVALAMRSYWKEIHAGKKT